MQSKPAPVKLIIVIAAAAVMVGIAVAIVANFQSNVDAVNEENDRFNVNVTPPDAVTVARGETAAIPVRVGVISQEPSDVQVWIYSADSPQVDTQGGDPELRFKELRQNGFAPGFTGSLDDEAFSLPASTQDAATRTVSLTLGAAGDMEPGDYYLVHSTFVKSGAYDYIVHGTFTVTVT